MGDLSTQSSMYFSSYNDRGLLDEETEENDVCRIRNLDVGTEFIVEVLGQDAW